MKTYSHIQPSSNKLVLRRRTIRRFNPRIFIDRTLGVTAVATLLFTGFAGVGAMGCWGLEIATNSHHWQQQKNVCLGGMLVGFSAFLGSALMGTALTVISKQ